MNVAAALTEIVRLLRRRDLREETEETRERDILRLQQEALNEVTASAARTAAATAEFRTLLEGYARSIEELRQAVGTLQGRLRTLEDHRQREPVH